ncbi:hypothetical protein TNCV_766431 [Trichonephila clavipes]|nr:hypothetical protein TNCV_766431 [Trichonephila clavipes]
MIRIILRVEYYPRTYSSKNKEFQTACQLEKVTRTSSALARSLVVKVMDAWLACHEFEPCTAEDPPCRGYRCTSNLSTLKRPPVRGCGSQEREGLTAKVSS